MYIICHNSNYKVKKKIKLYKKWLLSPTIKSLYCNLKILKVENLKFKYSTLCSIDTVYFFLNIKTNIKKFSIIFFICNFFLSQKF